MRGTQRWSTVVAAGFFVGGCGGGDCPAGSLRVENQCAQIEDANCAEPVALYRDVDGDGFGDSSEVTAGCSKTGFVPRGDDCDDTVASIHPEAPEQCNDVDDDCDGVVDDDPQTLAWFADLDGDGFGDEAPVIESCLQPEGYVPNALDCDDGNDAVSPIAQEECNGLDEDCSGVADDGPLMECAVGESVECTTECGGIALTLCGNECRIDSCPPPAESCNFVDDDCDGAIDNGVSSLVDLGSADLPFFAPSEFVHAVKAVSTSNGIVAFALVRSLSPSHYRLYGYRLSDDGQLVEGPVPSLTRTFKTGFASGPLDVAVVGNVAFVAMPPNEQEPTFGAGPELVRVSLVDLREVDSVGAPFGLGLVVWESQCIAATETAIAWGHRFTGIGGPSSQMLVQFYGSSMELGEGFQLKGPNGSGSEVPQCALAAASGSHAGQWVVAYDATPYVEVAVVDEEQGLVPGMSASVNRGSIDLDLSMLRDAFGEFVVVGEKDSWSVWRYALGVELEEVDRRIGFGQGGRRGDATYGRRVAAADGRLVLAGGRLDVVERQSLQIVQNLLPAVADAVVEHHGRVFVVGADRDAGEMRFYEIGCAP